MTSHYLSQENDPGYALHQLRTAIEDVRKFAAVRFYGDSVTLCAAAIEVDALSKDLTRFAKEVASLREVRLVAAE